MPQSDRRLIAEASALKWRQRRPCKAACRTLLGPVRSAPRMNWRAHPPVNSTRICRSARLVGKSLYSRHQIELLLGHWELGRAIPLRDEATYLHAIEYSVG